MLNFSDLALRRGARVLIEDASFSIYAGQRVGLVGRNGTGKSSLFALILGDLAPDRGELNCPGDLAIATVSQETPALALPAIEHVLDGDLELRAAEAGLAAAQARGDGQDIARWHERLDAVDGYAARSRAARLLHGLGFDAALHERPVAEFSGGWRVRINLARALIRRSDLLLLDEPTNHLDLDAVFWLREWLSRYPGTLLLISHDRDFLDGATNHTLHLHGGRATLYTGNYSSAERIRAERMAQQAASYAVQVKQAAHLQKFIDRFRAKASKARQAQSRIKQLERMKRMAPAHWNDAFDFQFAEPRRLPSPLLRIDDGAVGYGQTMVLAALRLGLEPGDRVGLLGRNGAGKSTLIRLLAGELELARGRMLRDPALQVGYFAQHQVDSLDAACSAMAHLQRLDAQASEQQLRTYLGGFDFRGDQVFAPVGPFSGGEKARLALALLVFQRPNLLLLDEPTNHLDMEMRHALEQALQLFAGAVVIVSHDRHLLDSCCDQLWRVGQGSCHGFAGDLDEYAALLQRESRAQDSAGAGAAPPGRTSAKDQRRSAADQRKRDKPLRDALRHVELEMARAETELAQLLDQLADPKLYAAGGDVAGLSRREGELRGALEQLELRWLDIAEQLE